jgi:hypothetical protein
MLKSLTLFIVLFTVTLSFSQDYLDKLVEDACSCVDKTPEFLGSCITNEALKYEKEIIRDYGVDARSITPESAPALLNVITAKMSGKCPATLQAAIEALQPHMNAQSEIQVEEETYYGTITSYSDAGVLSYMVENEQGETRKFIVLGQIECDLDFEQSYKNLVGKEVGIMFFQKEVFNPELGKYVNSNVITVLGVQ